MNTQIAARIEVAAVAIALILSSQLIAGEIIVDNTHGFTLTLPDGFVANPGLVGAAPNIVHAFVVGDPSDEDFDINLFIEKMRGSIGRERFKADDLPPTFKGRLFTAQWQGFEVDALEIPERLGDVQTITFNVQIPLKRAAIQVKIVGPSDRESEMKSLLAETLVGLKGDSNWIPSAAPSNRLTSSENYGVILLVFAVVSVVGGLLVLWLVSRKSGQGTVLAIAIGIYCTGLALDNVRVREVILLTSICKMLGFAGGILGIIDFVRKRKTKEEIAK